MRKRIFEYYCKEDISNIENYNEAKLVDFKGWHIHHRLETHNSDGERRLVDITAKELKALDMYYYRSADELIFLTKAEHNSLHFKGKHIPLERRKRVSNSLKGRPSPNKGKHPSEETRKKLSEASKGRRHSEEAKLKISESKKGKHYFNNGEIDVIRFECPEGFVPGRLHYKGDNK